MKGKKKILGLVGIVPILLFLAMVMKIHAQEPSRDDGQNETGEVTLRKTAQSREYQGREVEGEDKQVGPGDTLWRMLVKEKGLPEKRFSQYLVIIRGLNPQIKKIDVLRVGDTVFIPLRPDDLLGAPPVSAKATSSPRRSLEVGLKSIGSSKASISIKFSGSSWAFPMIVRWHCTTHW